MLVKLKQLQDAAGVVDIVSGSESFGENEGAFDDVGEPPSASDRILSQPTGTEVPAVEREPLALPSSGSVVGEAVGVELRLRTTQARRQVNRLRDIIADISFQYSHVIRGAIRRSVRTIAQKRIKSLHDELVLQARIYTRCRSRLIALHCDERWLKVFRVLHRSDLRASTAILRPNTPGASSLQLSWIWQTGRWYLFRSEADAQTVDADADGIPDTDADADVASLLECW